MSSENPRLRARLAERYRNDPRDEQFLEQLNEILAPHQQQEYVDLPDTYPIIFVVGVPRSGTTLMMQLLARHLDIGYVNNLIAAFWRAPIFGIRLSKKLLRDRTEVTYRSDFGRTSGLIDPHEFGYFWSELLGYGDLGQRDEAFEETIDWLHVRTVLNCMAHAFGGPTAFKIFHAAWHVARLHQVLPNTFFIWVRRDPFSNALSLMKMRREWAGSETAWTSMKPREYEWLKNEPVWTQLAGQVFYIEKWLEDSLEAVPEHRVIRFDYEDLCESPQDALSTVGSVVTAQGYELGSSTEVPEAFIPSRPNPETPQDNHALVEALARFYPERAG